MTRANQKFELEFPSTIQQVAKVEKFLEHIKATLEIDDERFYKILVATTEAVNNGIIHGNKRDINKKVCLRCWVENTWLLISVHDEGPGFDSDHIPDPRKDENLLLDHGRGVFLIRSLMDKVEFSNDPTGASVVMTLGLGAK